MLSLKIISVREIKVTMVLFMHKYCCKEMDFENHRITLASIHIILRNQSRSEDGKSFQFCFQPYMQQNITCLSVLVKTRNACVF